jgi:hypothetical protein
VAIRYEQVRPPARWALAVLGATLACAAWAQAPAAGQYERADGDTLHQIELRADGSGETRSRAGDGRLIVALRFRWSVAGDQLRQTDIAVQSGPGEFAPRPDMALQLRNVTPAGFEARARDDLPWINWTRK